MSDKFICSVSMANSIFEDDPSELARILRLIADQVDCTSNTGKSIVDSNGTKIGQWEIQMDKESYNG